MRLAIAFCILLGCLSSIHLFGQQISAPEPQPGSITGTVEDVDGGLVPGATVSVDGPAPRDHRSVTANESGFFTLNDLRPAASQNHSQRKGICRLDIACDHPYAGSVHRYDGEPLAGGRCDHSGCDHA